MGEFARQAQQPDGATEDKVMYAAYRKQWKKDNPDKVRAAKKRQRAKNVAKDMLRVKKSFCKTQNIAFNLTEADITPLPTHCPVLGMKLNYAAEGRVDNSPSLDRLVPALGYVQGNVKIISRRANRIKNDGTAEEIAKILAYVLENTNGAI
jgi:hypothetical protein